LLLMPIPQGERRSSGVSAPHSTYRGESHLLVNVSVTEVKGGCALGLVLEHLDEAGAPIAAENVSTYLAPRTHIHTTTIKGRLVRMKWILTVDKPSSTFGVITEGISSIPTPPLEDGIRQHSDVTQSLGVDLTTFQGLTEYVGFMKQGAEGVGAEA
jgi:hypothetical protein